MSKTQFKKKTELDVTCRLVWLIWKLFGDNMLALWRLACLIERRRRVRLFSVNKDIDVCVEALVLPAVVGGVLLLCQNPLSCSTSLLIWF